MCLFLLFVIFPAALEGRLHDQKKKGKDGASSKQNKTLRRIRWSKEAKAVVRARREKRSRWGGLDIGLQCSTTPSKEEGDEEEDGPRAEGAT